MNNYGGYTNPNGVNYYPYYGDSLQQIQQQYKNNYMMGQNPMQYANMQYPQQTNGRDFINKLSKFDGYYVDNYQEVKNAIVSADGTPSIFISNVEDVFWIKKINSDDGRTIVKAFSFKEDEGQEKLIASQNQQQQQQMAVAPESNIVEQLATQLRVLGEKIEVLEQNIGKQAQAQSANRPEVKESEQNAKQYFSTDF